ncbi:uncharacterized protein UV8b_01797 [Ustilaginoidea virens]|uniref:TAM domain methyltransferase n=1 Tax=Ustilaginoidea virens TaxID=1159556 RepID=A0A8E5MFJ1_USTVR|nr:uncharacterized protein UV8b_01797 [Ustilaginoidea virens]QUC17556.1 hypothetical protein UV8b_01797 [Ustilaginoidea virens]
MFFFTDSGSGPEPIRLNNENDSNSDFTSVSEDDLPPIHAYGHTYHGSGRVWVPNDVSEASRLNLQHLLFKKLHRGRLTHTRLPDEISHGDFEILDVGTGAGTWAHEMGRQYPSANILGTDLSVALLHHYIPPNVRFEVFDAAEPWDDRKYHFINMRDLVGGGIRDWKGLLSSAFAHLYPGGQLEFVQFRCESSQASSSADEVPDALQEYQRTLQRMCDEQGLDFDPASSVPAWLDEMGAENICSRVRWLPTWIGRDALHAVSARNRHVGELGGILLPLVLENWAIMLFDKGGLGEDYTRDLISRIVEEQRLDQARICLKLDVITASKPEFDDS